MIPVTIGAASDWMGRLIDWADLQAQVCMLGARYLRATINAVESNVHVRASDGKKGGEILARRTCQLS
jgi:hypothetical protein